ncbi:hypothetical protein SCUP234_04646 [Seiridium cupressi]
MDVADPCGKQDLKGQVPDGMLSMGSKYCVDEGWIPVPPRRGGAAYLFSAGVELPLLLRFATRLQGRNRLDFWIARNCSSSMPSAYSRRNASISRKTRRLQQARGFLETYTGASAAGSGIQQLFTLTLRCEHQSQYIRIDHSDDLHMYTLVDALFELNSVTAQGMTDGLNDPEHRLTAVRAIWHQMASEDQGVEQVRAITHRPLDPGRIVQHIVDGTYHDPIDPSFIVEQHILTDRRHRLQQETVSKISLEPR